NSRRVVVLCCLGLFAYAYSPSTVPAGPPDADGPIAGGVVVEKGEPGGAAARASLRRGDVLLSWKRGAASGDLRTPFDVSRVEIEQGPCGSVRLTGLRDGHTTTFDL